MSAPCIFHYKYQFFLSFFPTFFTHSFIHIFLRHQLVTHMFIATLLFISILDTILLLFIVYKSLTSILLTLDVKIFEEDLIKSGVPFMSPDIPQHSYPKMASFYLGKLRSLRTATTRRKEENVPPFTSKPLNELKISMFTMWPPDEPSGNYDCSGVLRCRNATTKHICSRHDEFILVVAHSLVYIPGHGSDMSFLSQDVRNSMLFPLADCDAAPPFSYDSFDQPRYCVEGLSDRSRIPASEVLKLPMSLPKMMGIDVHHKSETKNINTHTQIFHTSYNVESPGGPLDHEISSSSISSTSYNKFAETAFLLAAPSVPSSQSPLLQSYDLPSSQAGAQTSHPSISNSQSGGDQSTLENPIESSSALPTPHSANHSAHQ
ncbi:hypothetical protein VP01_68g6 [Puccinia sorghi]|uniref:Uncharacterized protein n=1 Tax=Puccinia sorghi TaxID=27349 RepID=A0A0L6UGE8_9BASI|nr:hypothetical protein VP01_68g6 [Puccinia sorghi]